MRTASSDPPGGDWIDATSTAGVSSDYPEDQPWRFKVPYCAGPSRVKVKAPFSNSS
jgi:hypothetical protein